MTDTPQPSLSDCDGPLHALAIKGIELFNAGRYWHAHEALELAWRLEKGEVRHLYRGILQVGVAYLHVQNHNYVGALKLYQRSRRWLDPFPDSCRGIDLRQLRENFDAVISEVRRLGPDHIDQFDLRLLKPIFYQRDLEL